LTKTQGLTHQARRAVMRMLEDRSATWAAGLRSAAASISSLASGMGGSLGDLSRRSIASAEFRLPRITHSRILIQTCQPRPPTRPAFGSKGGTMLTIFGSPHARGGFCDGVSRRDFLTIGGAIVGGALALPNLLRAGVDSSSHKSIINIYLPGGPPHQDMWDL